MLYSVNVTPPTAKDTMQLIDFIRTLGYYKIPEGKIAYPCTINMIDELCCYLKGKVLTMTIEDKVDLAIALMIMPLKPVLEVVDKCLTDVTLLQFEASCFNLVTSTNCFYDLFDKQLHFIDEGSLSIGLICRYLVGSKQDITVQEVGKKIIDIAKHIKETQYGPWTKIQLTTCGKTGLTGPTLEDCVEAYKTDWLSDKRMFEVSKDRPGIQKVTIPKTGLYNIIARGAGNKTKTGSGTVFQKHWVFTRDVVLSVIYYLL